MSKLNDYYHFMDSLGGKLTKKQLAVLEELEDQLIEEEILPAISESVAPVLNNLRNPLTLIVDYNPKTGTSVKTTRSEVKLDEREAKHYEIDSSKESKTIHTRRQDKVHWDIRTDKHYEGQLMIKEVDWSTFNAGITIPMPFQFAFEHAINMPLIKGEGVPVKVWIANNVYNARVIDVKFSDPKRKRCIQLTWTRKSPIALKLQELMPETYAYMKEQKEKSNSAQMIKLPENLQREIVICSIPEHDGYLFVIQ